MIKTPFTCLYFGFAVIAFTVSAIYTFVTGDLIFSDSQLFKHWLDKKIFDIFGGYVLGTLQLLAAAFFVWLLIKDCKSDEGGGSEMS